jgi:L-lactate dehydrogenase complex protein LldG
VADLGLFRTRLEELGGRLHETGTLAAARALAVELIGTAHVARWEDPVLDGITAAGAVVADVAGDAAVSDVAGDAAVSLITADVAVAQTGAIGFAHGAGRPRWVGLLPARQVAVAPLTVLVDTMAQALDRFFPGPGGTVPANVVFVAGPSRTSDIEQRSIQGMHAPKTLDVIFFNA